MFVEEVKGGIFYFFEDREVQAKMMGIQIKPVAKIFLYA